MVVQGFDIRGLLWWGESTMIVCTAQHWFSVLTSCWPSIQFHTATTSTVFMTLPALDLEAVLFFVHHLKKNQTFYLSEVLFFKFFKCRVKLYLFCLIVFWRYSQWHFQLRTSKSCLRFLIFEILVFFYSVEFFLEIFQDFRYILHTCAQLCYRIKVQFHV